MARLTWWLQQLFPPLLLSYFAWAWKVCTFEIGPIYIAQQLNHPNLARVYSLIPTILILPITLLYTALYFLPSSQSVPPFHPPPFLSASIHQCLSPPEALSIRTSAGESHDPHQPLLDRCYKGRCRGRWKPARARHCSECGICRMGFDHHCALFGNCLTAPYIPTFLLLLLYTPPTTFLISCPVYLPLLRRAHLAYVSSCSIPRIQGGWYAKWWSWIIVGGPIGRIAGGTILAWREMDRREREQGVDSGLRLGLGVVIALGAVLAMITGALAYTTITLILQGSLTIDRERHRSHYRALRAIISLQAEGRPVPPALTKDMEKWGERRWFFVPISEAVESPSKVPSSMPRDQLATSRVPESVSGRVSGAVGGVQAFSGDERVSPENIEAGRSTIHSGLTARFPRSDQYHRNEEIEGVVIQTEPGERPYDLGKQANWELLMGPGWGWLFVWNAVFRRRLDGDRLWNWPMRPEVERRLRAEGEKIARQRRGGGEPDED